MSFSDLAPAGFTFEHVLAEGAFFRVIRVEKDGARFACRRLTPRTHAEPAAAAMLAMEADVLQALAGRGAPVLAGSGSDAYGPWVLVAWAPGEMLAEYMNRSGADVVRAAVAAFGALAAIHGATDAQGALAIAHGDVRPDNVVVASSVAGDASADGGGRGACFIDFVLASMRGHARAIGGAFAGSLLYAAPEAARGEAHGQPADVFSLALSIAHVATGAAPRSGKSAADLLLEAAEQPPPAVDVASFARNAVAPDGARMAIPDAGRIAAALNACLELDPTKRPRAREVLAALPALAPLR